jgi:hypothetical protein
MPKFAESNADSIGEFRENPAASDGAKRQVRQT